MAVQEAADLSREQGVELVGAVASLPDCDLVFLGGRRWKHAAALQEAAGEMGVGDRIHLVGDASTANRVDYLGQADVGLALSNGGFRRGQLPAADVFDTLGVPFVTLPGLLDAESASGIAALADRKALRTAIVEASARKRLPAREDGDRVLEELIVEITALEGWKAEPMSSSVSPGPAQSNGWPTAVLDEGGADALLSRAKLLRDRGDRNGAIRIYSQVATCTQVPTPVATAAAALARLDARGEAWVAIERVMEVKERPPLATARAGEAAAVLGDLVLARTCADDVVDDPAASAPALRNAIRVLEQVGEPRAALRIARRIDDKPGVARIEGVLKSYDPAWLPTAGARASLRPRTGRSLVLLETSLPYARSGYTYRAQTLLRAQRQAGVEPVALTRLGFPATRGLNAPPREEVDGVVHHRAGLSGVTHYTSVPVSEQLEANVRWAVKLGREFAPEGIVATTPHLNGLVGLALRRQLGIPMIYDVRGFPEMTWAVRKGGGSTDAFGLRRVAETRCMREADLVVTLSETMRRQIVGRGISPEKVFVLPHAVDTDSFAPRERDNELAASLGLDGRPVIGYISSLVPYEGVETLIDAIALARRTSPDVASLIVGGGELLSSLEARVQELGLDGHVVFSGRVEASEVMRYYSIMDVFVCPRHDHEVTRYVTPLKPFEAMAAGSCLAVSDLPTLREAVRDGECGALFPAGDADALASTILDLVERPERRRELECEAREHVVASHGFETLSRRFEEVWEELRRR
jgi:glycosyltransferase involved in cell wall biosynthesis